MADHAHHADVPSMDYSEHERTYTGFVHIAEVATSVSLAIVAALAVGGVKHAWGTALVGTPACGLALTQACRQDPEKWKAALSLAQKILGAEGESGLVTAAGGKLAESMAELTMSAQDVSGILYDRDPEGFDDGAERVISGLMGE